MQGTIKLSSLRGSGCRPFSKGVQTERQKNLGIRLKIKKVY